MKVKNVGLIQVKKGKKILIRRIFRDAHYSNGEPTGWCAAMDVGKLIYWLSSSEKFRTSILEHAVNNNKDIRFTNKEAALTFNWEEYDATR